jgi:stress response protein YsnF
MDLEDNRRSGRPSTSRNADTIANIREMMTRDRRCTLRMLSEELNINKETIHQSSVEVYERGRGPQGSS